MNSDMIYAVLAHIDLHRGASIVAVREIADGGFLVVAAELGVKLNFKAVRDIPGVVDAILDSQDFLPDRLNLFLQCQNQEREEAIKAAIDRRVLS